MTERVQALRSAVTIMWMPGLATAGVYAHDVTILPSSWIRVTWLDGSTSHVSPAVVREIKGKGVSYGA